MAFGTGSRSFGPKAVLYSFKIKTKDLPSPLFDVKKKVGDEYVPQKETATRVSGTLISASPRENTHQGKVIKSINLTLQDGDDVYFVSVGYTYIGRNLFNSLLALKTFDDIEIGLYQSKPKPDAKIKTGFASVALRQHGELVRGPFDPKKDLPPIKKIVLNGATVSDTTDVDAFFDGKMKAFCKVVNAAAPKPVSAPAHGDTEIHTDVLPEGEDVDGEGSEPTGEAPF